LTTCLGKGECSSTGACICHFGIGAHCEIDICYDIPATAKEVCSSHGKCQSYNNCECFPNFEGRNCEVAQSEPILYIGLSIVTTFALLALCLILCLIMTYLRRSSEDRYKADSHVNWVDLKQDDDESQQEMMAIPQNDDDNNELERSLNDMRVGATIVNLEE